jgi:hypothetical protein
MLGSCFSLSGKMVNKLVNTSSYGRPIPSHQAPKQKRGHNPPQAAVLHEFGLISYSQAAPDRAD